MSKSRPPPASYRLKVRVWRIIAAVSDRKKKASFLQALVKAIRGYAVECVQVGHSHALITLITPRNKFAFKKLVKARMKCAAADIRLEAVTTAAQNDTTLEEPAPSHAGQRIISPALSLSTKYCALVVDNLQTTPSNYVIKELLGAGTYGEVYFATSNDHSQKAALKYIRCRGIALSGNVAAFDAQICLEIAVLELLASSVPACPNIVKLLDVFRNSTETVLAMEYGGRTMYSAVNDGFFNRASTCAIADVLSQVASGLRHIHDHGVVHADLSWRNVLIDDAEGVRVRYADFGCAFFASLPRTAAFDQEVTTLPFRAPELLLGGPFGMPCDVWSVGCLVYAMLTGALPWEGTAQGPLLIRQCIKLGSPVEHGWTDAQGYPNYSRIVVGRPRRYIGEQVAFEFGDLMDALLALNPAQRCSAAGFVSLMSRVKHGLTVQAKGTASYIPVKILHRITAKVPIERQMVDSFVRLVREAGFDEQAHRPRAM